MNNNMLIEKKQGIIHKIIDFFKNIFGRKEQKSIEPNDNIINSTENISDDELIDTENDYKISKKEFMELYEKAKNNEVDLLSLDINTLEKMCKLIQEEIKIVEKANLKIEQEIKEVKAMLNNGY